MIPTSSHCHEPRVGGGRAAPSVYRVPGRTGQLDPARRAPLVIEQRWRTEPLMAVCALGWLAFQPALFMAAHQSNAFATHHGLGALCLLCFGFVYFYRSLVGFTNRSTLTIAEHDVYIRFGPIPWPGARRIALDDIASVELVESPQTWFQRIVVARLRDGRSLPLALGIRSRAQGRYLARTASKEIRRRQGHGEAPAPRAVAHCARPARPTSTSTHARPSRRSARRAGAHPRKRYRDAFGSYW